MVEREIALPEPAAWSDLDSAGAERWATERGQPRYRGRQLFEAIQRRGIADVGEMHEFPASLRRELAARAPTRTVRERVHLVSKRDGSEKVLLELADGAMVEAVSIPSGTAEGWRRSTICVSSQVGCPAACTFCATGVQGFSRNLSGTEIVDQVMYFVPRLAARRRRVTNVVFMGMG
ncbi:MAG: 23S rRNA (adenine(2503)-C(2))-methyltransferase RlmN, partial [Chloroflexi bacterium]